MEQKYFFRPKCEPLFARFMDAMITSYGYCFANSVARTNASPEIVISVYARSPPLSQVDQRQHSVARSVDAAQSKQSSSISRDPAKRPPSHSTGLQSSNKYAIEWKSK